jgi:hypothetical protein
MADDELDIDEIRFRADNATAPDEADDVLADDVPSLCDEVERLRSALRDVVETDTHDAGRLKWIAEQALEGSTDDDQQ